MYDDKNFAIYALGLIGAVACLLTAMVVFGIASAPPVGFMTEHLVVALGLRTSYKSLGGADWLHDFLEYTGMITGNAVAAEAPAAA